jgi:HEAT repeat protein
MRNDKSRPEETRKAIEALVSALSSPKRQVREEARTSLVALGNAAVEPLREALKGPARHTRWEAAKALSQIGDPAAAPALVAALEHLHFDVAWLAAEGLIRMGTAGLPALLSALENHPESLALRDAAHHVLHTQTEQGQNQCLEPLLQALGTDEPNVTIIVLAAQAREALESGAPSRRRSPGAQHKSRKSTRPVAR